MRKSVVLMLASLSLLASCATAPAVLVKAICPRPPALDQPPAAQEPDFIERMQALLSGKLPAPTDFSLTSPNAKLSTTKSGTP